jgi:hypothetical protein
VAEARDFCSLYRSRPVLGLTPVSYPMDVGDCNPGGKTAGREADHYPQSDAEVKIGRANNNITRDIRKVKIQVQ